MAFRLDPKVPLDRALRDAASREIESAIAWTKTSTRGASSTRRTHEIRKSMKRLRALSRLIREGIPERRWIELNREFRSIARSQAGRRDGDVLLATIALLSKNCEPAVAPSLRKLAAAVKLQRVAKQSAAKVSARQLEARLRAVSSGIQKLAIRHPEATVKSGLARCWRKVRRTARDAGDTPTDEAFHELRKAVQVYQRQMQLFQATDPGTLKPRIKAARTIAEILGEEHDLSMLRGFANRAAGLTRQEKARIGEICRSRQQTLRRQALVATSHHFSSKAKTFAREISQCRQGLAAKAG